MLADLKPILIASPIQRSGTTLLQRLLSSSPDTLIFGETCANDLNMLVGLYLQKQSMYGRGNEWRAEQLQKVLGGEVNDWIPDLMPEPAEYVERFEKAIADFLGYFAEFARKHGREQWGVKLPAWNVYQLEQLLQIMPGARAVYIVRGLEACVRSAKQMEFCQDLADTQQFAQFWQMNLREAQRRLRSDKVLWIDYDDLVNEPGAVLRKLAHFTGSRSIDHDVMNYRIGNYHRETPVLSTLSTEEIELIRRMEMQISRSV